MKTRAKQFQVRPGDKVDLRQQPTRIDPVYTSKQDYRALLNDHVDRLSAQQELLYAANRHAVLIIFQAMDAAGKDGCIKHVMSGVNPQGCDVFSFSHPSPSELQHDFLWRSTRNLPERGKIVIFNRSYYEEVLIVRVHPEILAAEALPESGKADKVWKHRFRSINGLERHLRDNGTRIVKFFLHISKEEQRRRLLERIDTPDKNWKIKTSDIEERKYWREYQDVYEACLSETSTDHAPWYIIPADDKLSARLLVSHIILETLEGLDMSFPKATAERRAELDTMRKQLEEG